MSNSIPSTPRRHPQSETDTETSSLVSSPSASEQSSASEDGSETSVKVPVMKTRPTRDTAQAIPATQSTNSSAPPQATMTPSSPTVTNRQTVDQKRTRYAGAHNLTAYQRDTSIKKIKQGGAASTQQAPKPDRTWEKFSKAVTAKGELTVRKLSERDIIKLAAWLRTSPAALRALIIPKLQLPGNQIGFDGTAVLAGSLRFNKTLSELALQFNSIGDEGAVALANMLQVNTALTKLDLSYNDISDFGTAAIGDALRDNTTLTAFCMSKNEIGDGGAVKLANVLRSNTKLTSLDLFFNEIRDEGAVALAEALKFNKTLTFLNLGSNEIGDTGAVALAEALKFNKTLTFLKLGLNEIGDTGAVALADALQHNSTLIELHLGFNQISAVGALVLAQALKHNETLTTLTTRFNFDGYEDIERKIHKHLERNIRLKLMPYAEASLDLLVKHSPGLKDMDGLRDVLPRLGEHLSADVTAIFEQAWKAAFRAPAPPVTTTTTDTNTTTTTTNTTTTTTTTDSTIPTTSPAATTISPALAPPVSTQPTATVNALLAAPSPDVALLRWIDGHANPAATLNWVDPVNGYTLLHYAVEAQQIAVIRSLLIRGIDRKKADHNNQTAAQLAQARADSSSSQLAANIAALLR